MILAIIQARMGATRLPGKVLLDLNGKTVLERVIERVLSASLIDEVMVATTGEEQDRPIIALCHKNGVACYGGSESDVLDRFYQAAVRRGPDHVVRITADCPLIDPAIIDEVIKRHLAANADYTSNTLEETFPDGEDVEVFSFSALQEAWRDASLVSEREHVTPYIRKNGGQFKLVNVANGVDLSAKRWTLDRPEDYRFISGIYQRLGQLGPLFGMASILSLLKREPGLEMLNQGIQRNEGYARSLQEDRTVKAIDG